MDDPWYSARCILRHAPSESSGGKLVYEERVVLFRAANFEDAIRQAEGETDDFQSVRLSFFTGAREPRTLRR